MHTILALFSQGKLYVKAGYRYENGYIIDLVCVESALFHYGYTDFTPREWSVAVPRNISQAKIKAVDIPVKAYYIQPDVYELGKAQADFDGTVLSIYDNGI